MRKNKISIINKTVLSNEIDEIIKEWQPTGAMCITEDGQTVLKKTYGFADKNNIRPISPDEKYFFSFNEKFFPAFALFFLIDNDKVKLSDKLSKFVPEYAHSDIITVKHLLEESSAIPCWFNGKIMVDFDQSSAHNNLPVEERIAEERVAFSKDRSLSEKLDLIKDLPLEDTPGNLIGEYSSYSANMFIAEIISRVSGKSLYAFLNDIFFLKYGIVADEGDTTTTDNYVVIKDCVPVYVPKTPSMYGISMTIEEATKFIERIRILDFFSEKTIKLLFKKFNASGGYLFQLINGWAGIFIESADGSALNSLINFNRKTTLVTVNSRANIFRFIDGSMMGFVKKIRLALQRQIVYPLDPKMIKFGLKNCFDAMSLTIREDQMSFVSDAKASLCWSYAEKDCHSYVLTDDGVAIGLLVLKINKKKNQYYIGVILIDKNYQGRGYGRFMVNFAVETLKTAGATELTIGVNRNNVVARKLYESVGFKAAGVYDEGVFMKLTF